MAEIRKVDPEVMSTQANTLDGIKGNWQSAVSAITALKESLDAMWDGLANDQFNQRWTEDLKKYDKLTEVLESYITAIKDAVSKYESYEQEIANIVKD
jgi:WXG100 family type VII secretion target